MAQTYNPYTGDYLTYGTSGGEWPFFLSSNPTVAPVSTPTVPSTPPVPSAAALQAALAQQLGNRSSNRGTGTQSGGPFAGQAPADVAQGYANANVAMKPSLMNSLRMATGITNPVSMLGQLGLSALLGMPGLSAFNVGGTEMPESDTAAIQAAAPTMPTSQVGLMTPMTDTLNSIRAGTFNGSLGNFGQSDSGAANPLAGATSLGPNMPGVMQTQGGQLALSDPAAIAGMVAAGNTYSGNSGNAGQGGSGNQGGGGGGGGGSNAGAGGGGSHKGERYGGRIHSRSIRRYDSGGDVTSADIQAQPIAGDLSTGAPTDSQFLSQLLGSFGGSGYLSPYVSQFLSGLVKGIPSKGTLTAGNPAATTAGSSASQGNQPYFPYTATTYGQGPAWAFFGQQNPLVAYADGGKAKQYGLPYQYAEPGVLEAYGELPGAYPTVALDPAPVAYLVGADAHKGMAQGGTSRDRAIQHMRGNVQGLPVLDARGGTHVSGPGDGQEDKIPAMLSDGEYVLDSALVSRIGAGSNSAGAKKLDRMREIIRAHERAAPPGSIPSKPKALSHYMKQAGM